MKNFLENRRNTLIMILVLAVGSISIMATTHLAMADQKGELCVFFACGNANITGGTSGGGQPTPNTATLIVTKVCIEGNTPIQCPINFQITVTGNNPSPSSFPGSATGTKVTLGPGQYTVSESPEAALSITFSGNCSSDFPSTIASGTIAAGEKQKCTITNKF